MNLQKRLYGDNAPPYQLDYVNDVAEALLRVEEKYCEWIYNTESNNQKIERVFAYELYHQFKLLTFYDNKYQNLRLDGELGKDVIAEFETCGLVMPSQNQVKYFPDLVIHFGQTSREEGNQKVIIEIKTKEQTGEAGNKEIQMTILKLNHYLRVLNFQYAIFISVNTDFSKLITKLKSLFTAPDTKSSEERFNRIIIMNYNDRIVSTITLKNILTDNDHIFN